MAGMKITVDAAMRARDVSRPTGLQEEAAEAGPDPVRPARPARPARPPRRGPRAGEPAADQGSGGSTPDFS
jgi:hypothetical protein